MTVDAQDDLFLKRFYLYRVDREHPVTGEITIEGLNGAVTLKLSDADCAKLIALVKPNMMASLTGLMASLGAEQVSVVKSELARLPAAITAKED